MKTIVKIVSIIVILVVMFSCSKKKRNEPELKKQEYFVKKIERVFPEDGAIRKSTFGYDEKNRIKEFEFVANTVTYQTKFTYNDLDLIIRADQDMFFAGSDRSYGKILEFKYAADKLIDYVEDGVSAPVTYNASNNSYTVLSKVFYWDANNNLKRIISGSRIRVDVSYLSGKGVFKIMPVQMALVIFSENVGKTISLSYTASMDNLVFSKNEIASLNDNEIRANYFSNIRDEHGNIIQTDVKNETGVLIRRYTFVYELRDVE